MKVKWREGISVSTDPVTGEDRPKVERWKVLAANGERVIMQPHRTNMNFTFEWSEIEDIEAA